MLPRPLRGTFFLHAAIVWHILTTSWTALDGLPFVLQDEPLGCLLPLDCRLLTPQDGVLTTQIFEAPL
jgi:hypothetical protein